MAQTYKTKTNGENNIYVSKTVRQGAPPLGKYVEQKNDTVPRSQHGFTPPLPPAVPSVLRLVY